VANLQPVSNPSREVRLYYPTLNAIPNAISAVLSAIAQIPPSEQVQHVITLRDRAYQSHPYPCLGRFRFLDLDLSTHPLYTSYILPTLTSASIADDDAIYLDLGCCLGQDLRKLVYDGVSVSRLYGADLRPEFIDIGYGLWRDEDQFPRDHFITPADVFDTSSSNALQRLDGKVSILHVCAVFHLFELEEQFAVARRCLKLLKKPSDHRRALICGSHMGNVTAGYYDGLSRGQKFRHNEQSWKEMWEKVAGEPESKDQIKGIEVSSELHKVSRGNPSFDKVATFGPVQDDAGLDANQRRTRHIEQGFRWMVFSVWVDFA